MIITGGFSPDRSYYHEFLAKGILGILKYPALHKILGRFDKYDESKYDHNIFLVFANVVESREDKHIADTLGRMNEFIEKFVGRLSKESRNHIYSRMRSFDKEQNHSVYLEMQLWMHFIKHSSIESVQYEAENNDFSITVGDELIRFEFCMPGPVQLLENIRKSFEAAAKKICALIDAPKILRVNVEVLRTDGQADYNIEKMKEHIVSSTMQNMPLITVLDGLTYVRDYEILAYDRDMSEITWLKQDARERIDKLRESPKGREYLEFAKTQKFSELPVSSYIYSPAIFPYVEIQSTLAWPTTWAAKLSEIILTKLKRSLKDKIEKGQLRGKENSFVIISFQDSMFLGYTDTEPLLNRDGREKINRLLQDCFVECEENTICGVLLFDRAPEKMMLVRNPKAKIPKETLDALAKVTSIIEV